MAWGSYKPWSTAHLGTATCELLQMRCWAKMIKDTKVAYNRICCCTQQNSGKWECSYKYVIYKFPGNLHKQDKLYWTGCPLVGREGENETQVSPTTTANKKLSAFFWSEGIKCHGLRNRIHLSEVLYRKTAGRTGGREEDWKDRVVRKNEGPSWVDTPCPQAHQTKEQSHESHQTS